MTQDNLPKIETLLTSISTRLDSLEKNIETEREHTRRMIETSEQNLERNLKKAIQDSQEDTINALSELINNGFNEHEKRFEIIEDHLDLPRTPSH